MDKEIGSKWVAELRSAKYSQGRGTLRTNDSYCCLGVLCEMAVQAEVIGSPQAYEMFGGGLGYTYGGEETVIPWQVKTWAGMQSNNGQFENETTMDFLAALNDQGMTFAELADIIEANMEDL